MLKCRFGLTFQFRHDTLRQHLAQLHAPLVEGIDVPEDALGKDRMFIEGHKLAERFRCEPLDEGVVMAIEGAADELGLRHTRLMSFAGHDTQAMSRVTPSAMLFVPSVDGISHNPAEYTRDEDVVNGANVVLHTLLRMAGG